MNKKSTPTKVVVLMIPLIMAVVGACHSSDLGAQKPDRVPVDLSLTGWDGGAGKVIAQKCANCHTSARSAFVPDNTPHDLDGIESLDFFKKPENLGIVKSMRKRIESADPSRQMPPRFATPLYDDEKAALLAFLKSVEDGQIKPDPCPKIMTLSFTALRHGDDDDDHADDDDSEDHHQPSQPGQGDGPVVTPTNPDPCGQAGGGAGGGGTGGGNTNLTFNDVSAIVTANCSGCHNGTRAFNLKTREDFFSRKDQSRNPLSEILAGSMPLRNPGFKDTADGKLLIQWLQGPQTQ